MKTLRVEVVSAEARIMSADGAFVVVPGEMGDIGILPGHQPLMSRLRPGELRLVLPDKAEEIYYLSGGYVEIQPHLVSVLADTVLRAEAIDAERARAAHEEASALLKRGVIGVDYAEAKAQLARATAQLRVLEDIRKRQRKKS